ncbi:MAG TPA: hypothetical protein VGU46_11115 [Acidobacteriaceae bacterium]|nr:hypothetical protein [Acidobacteriaceae bacterium]
MALKVRAYAVLIALCGGVVGMAVGAVYMLRAVFRTGTAFEDRVEDAVWAVLLLLPLIFVARYFVRMRLRTGRWRGTPEVHRQEREQRRTRCATDGVCSARANAWTHYYVQWASYAAMDRALPVAQRIWAWGVLAIYVLGLAGLAVIGLMCLVMALTSYDSPGLLVVFVGFALATWLIPGLAVRSLIRGIRSGKVGATREEVEELRAMRNAKRVGEWQKPLGTKLKGMAISMAIIGFVWVRYAVRHAQHQKTSWVEPAFWTAPLVYSMWMQFRRPKRVVGE